MKLFLIIVSFINAGYMLADGIFVLLNGKYIGPEKQGPWASLFSKLNIDAIQLGPLFITYGVLWFLFIYSIQSQQTWASTFGISLAIATLWYLPFGTLISTLTIIMLLFFKENIGLS